MAQRESLRALHTRLAARLQNAKDQGLAVSWLAVRAGSRWLLLSLAQAGEILPPGDMQTVPYVQPWFRGVHNVRGAIYGVVDLARFLGEERPPAGGGAEGARVVTLNATLELQCALLVDAVLGLRSTTDFGGAVLAPPDGGAAPWLGSQYRDASGQVWQELDLVRLATAPAFLNIRA